MIDGNDPAFPAPEAARQHFGDPSVYPGMSLRDYFAAQALQGMLANPNRMAFGWTDFARMSYHMADALLTERLEK
jgi:hypothetical protein